MSSRRTPTKDAQSEVEDLLKAVEDDMLLNLSLNSHMSRVSPDYLHSDLDRRFRALRSPPSSSSSPVPDPIPPPPPPSAVDPPPRLSPPEHPADPELKAVLGDDIAARFAALKASLPSSESAPVSVTAVAKTSEDSDREDEDNEVERLIQWAKDAARLDPSPPSDDDDDDDDDDDNDEDEDDRRHTK